MKKIKIALFLLVFFSAISFSYGWGVVGHNIVAGIAKTYVSKNTLDSVNKYLGDMTWEKASTWMDEQRSNSQYDYMKQWHYINMDKDLKYDSTIANGNNVVYQLQLAINKLMKRSSLTKDDINLNLKIIFHLVGDLHQPLHVGYGSDKGGNDIKVTFNGKTVNLHHLWDTGIIENKNITLSDIKALYSKLSKHRIKKISDGDVIKWMNETRKMLDSVYSYSNVISVEYIDKSSIIIEDQLLNAGIRLGKVLNTVFEK